MPSIARFHYRQFNVVLGQRVNLPLSFGVIAVSHAPALRQGLRFILIRTALPLAIPPENFARDAPIPFAQPAVAVRHPGISGFSDAQDQAATELEML